MQKQAFSTDEAKIIGNSLGIDWEHFDVDEFRLGLDLEREEHGSRNQQTDLTHNDPLLTGKIVLAHLQKLPDYYTRLAKMEAEAAEISPEIDQWVNTHLEGLYEPKQAATWAALQAHIMLEIENLTSRINNLQSLKARAENGAITQLDQQIEALKEDQNRAYEKKLETLQAQQQTIADTMKELELQNVLTVMKVRAKFETKLNRLKAALDAVKAQWQADVEALLIAWKAEIDELEAGQNRANLTQADDAFSAEQIQQLKQKQKQWHTLRAALEDALRHDISTWSIEASNLKAQRTGCDTWEEFERSQQISTLLDRECQAEAKLHRLRDMALQIETVPEPAHHNQPEWLGFRPIQFH